MGIRPNFADDVYGEKERRNEDPPEYSESSLAHRRSANVLKLKQLKEAQPMINSGYNALPQQESTENSSEKDLVFEYGDCDSGIKEMAELYSYSEMEEFATNLTFWREYIDEMQDVYPDLVQNFEELTDHQQSFIIEDLCGKMESANSDVRLNAARIILYILQGSACRPSDEEPWEMKSSQHKDPSGDGPLSLYHSAIENSFICYKNGVYQSLCTLLMTEIKEPFECLPGVEGRASKASSRDSRHASYADLSDSERFRTKQAPTMADNEILRVILAGIYHMVVQIMDENSGRFIATSNNESKENTIRKSFLEEIQEPIENGNEPLLIVLFDMLDPFYVGASPHFPIKKIVLLIWKILLYSFGGWSDLEEAKREKRRKAGLPLMEDTLKTAAAMPTFVVSESEMVRPFGVNRMGSLARQMAYNDDTIKDEEIEGSSTSDSSETTNPFEPAPDSSMRQGSGEQTPRVTTPVPFSEQKKFLPWKSKATNANIEHFIQNGRLKYFNYNFNDTDDTTLFGLPHSFIAAVDILRKNLYTSLAEIQVAQDEELNRYLFSRKEEIEETKTEMLYRKILPNITQYICALLRVLVPSFPSNKARHDGINVLIDVLTPEMEASDILSNSISLDNSSSSPLEDGFRLAIDINRHKEIIVKSISAILLLLVKHFKLNHIYQSEYICQQIVYMNGIPLILKFLDQNTVKLIQSRHEIYAYNYPQCLYHYVTNGEEWPTLTQDNIEEPRSSHSGPYYLWRNVFYTINFIRLLNKLVKGKNDRVKMLMAYKSAPILKRLFKVRLSILQFYILKAIKMQSRYLGRPWRKSNMEIISAIYSRVRHRMTDDWAFASDIKGKCDYQKEDAIIKACIERFHSRRYAKYYPQFAIEVNDAPMPGDDYLNRVDMRDFEPIDNCAHSVLGQDPKLGKKFKKNYEKWLEKEVFRQSIDWDKLLLETRGINLLL